MKARLPGENQLPYPREPGERRSPGAWASLLPILLPTAIFPAACSNNMSPLTTTSGSSTTTTSAVLTPGGTAQTTPGSVQGSFVINRVQITESGTGAGATGTVNLFFDGSQVASNPLTNYCGIPQVGSTGQPNACVCQFSWMSGATATSPGIARSVTTPLTTVQGAAASCATPSVFYTEIPNSTTVRITLAPDVGNTTLFAVTGINYVMGGSTGTTGGVGFTNILRYSCFEQVNKGLSLTSRLETKADTAGNSLTFPLANFFCMRTADGTLVNGTGCTTTPQVAPSSQSNYFNLFLPETQLGGINPGNNRFTCPTVKEALGQNTVTGLGQGQYWPLDSSFALSQTQTTSFTVGVLAHLKTSNPNDPTSVNSDCFGNTSPAAANSLVTSCLGFAAPANSDGTCPLLSDSAGNPLQTYRLRSYTAIYPRLYNANGSSMGDSQAIDNLYVIDRPVANAANPLAAYAMLGPKPCPYAYFDKTGAITGNTIPGYYGTNFPSWTGTDVDGVQFPNVDSNAANSCSAAIPLMNATQTLGSITTINAGNFDPSYQRRFVRPITAWAPHYEEDLSFQACAPLATPLQDPPLHFSKTASGNVAWCAEAYPTQNDNITKLDVMPTATTYSGQLAPFTSHVASNSISGACTPTQLSNTAGYAASGTAWQHIGAAANTCDRTVINPTGGTPLVGFPLLAPASSVEQALAADSSFSCLITHDNGVKTNRYSPSQGCCGMATQVWTVPGTGHTATTAHLEPAAGLNPTVCASPQW